MAGPAGPCAVSGDEDRPGRPGQGIGQRGYRRGRGHGRPGGSTGLIAGRVQSPAWTSSGSASTTVRRSQLAIR